MQDGSNIVWPFARSSRASHSGVLHACGVKVMHMRGCLPSPAAMAAVAVATWHEPIAGLQRFRLGVDVFWHLYTGGLSGRRVPRGEPGLCASGWQVQPPACQATSPSAAKSASALLSDSALELQPACRVDILSRLTLACGDETVSQWYKLDATPSTADRASLLMTAALHASCHSRLQAVRHRCNQC
jgi:hypothetical protein